MKDELPQKINKIECGIINLENHNKNGIEQLIKK